MKQRWKELLLKQKPLGPAAVGPILDTLREAQALLEAAHADLQTDLQATRAALAAPRKLVPTTSSWRQNSKYAKHLNWPFARFFSVFIGTVSL